MKAHTLHIGTNYTNSMSELAGCVPDANRIYTLCKPAVTTATKITGHKADREGIVNTFRRVRHRLENPGDLLFVSLSCHGTNEDGYQGIVCDDFEVIWDYEMDAAIEDRAPGTFCIFLLDCCHADGLGDARPTRRSRPSAEYGPRIKSIPIDLCRSHPKEAKPKARAKVNCGYIAGCETDSYSYDGWLDGKPAGALSWYTEQAFRELRHGAKFYDLFQKVGGKRPRGFLPSTDYPQQPTRMGSRKNFAREIPFL